MTVTLDERVGYLLLGVLIGFVLGYFTRHIRKIEKSIVHVEEVICKNDQDEGGFMRIPSWNKLAANLPFRLPRWRSVALFLVVVMTLWASIQSQIVSNQQKANTDEDRKIQESISKVTFCNQQAISKVIVALNERVESNRGQTAANVALQKAFLDFLKILQFQPPKPQAERLSAFNGYVLKLNNFVEKADENKKKGDQFPYPTFSELSACLDKPLSEIKKDPEYER